VASAPRPAGLPRWAGRYVRRKVDATLARWGTTCHLCGQDGANTADHLTPRSKGGSDDVEANLRPAHRSCNIARGAMTVGEWFRLHPRPTRPHLAPSGRWTR
jgi:5-methylcytosine-specific restriction endonuclease McrA